MVARGLQSTCSSKSGRIQMDEGLVMHSNEKRCAWVVTVILAGAFLLTACSPPPSPPGTAAVPEVEVRRVAYTEIPNIVELPGRVEAFRVAEVRARVSGIVSKRLYLEGQAVKAGTPLFLINPEQLQAALLEAEADVAKAEAQLRNATDKWQRYAALVSDQSVSQRDFQSAAAEVQLAKADLASAQAKLHSARLDLAYAHVDAPIDGVARRALVTEGALVGKDEATHMTTVEQVNPVYVNFAQSSSEVFALQKALRKGELKSEGGPLRLELVLPDGSVYPQTGRVSFADVSVNPATDSVLMRAVFDNSHQILMPGAYVRLRIRQAAHPHAILVPRDALIRDQTSTRVLVVDDDQRLISKTVESGGMYGNDWVILHGLQPGDRVVLGNVTTLVAGSTVKVKNDAPPAPPRQGLPST